MFLTFQIEEVEVRRQKSPPLSFFELSFFQCARMLRELSK